MLAISLFALLAPSLLLQQPPAEDFPVLHPEETLEGEIAEDAPRVHTKTLDTNYTGSPTVGKTLLIQVEEAGVYHIDLTSYHFDAYLVLRDGDGQVLVEDDDGGVDVNSRVVMELVPGREYRAQACALHDRRGPFVVSLASGPPPTIRAAELRSLERADAERRLAATEASFGSDHSKTAQGLNQLALLLYAQGDYEAARPLFERAVGICERALGPEHPWTATSLNNLAELLRATGDHEGARPLYERALKIRERTLGPEAPSTATSLRNLAELLRASGDYGNARSLHERALEIREQVLGPNHPDTATSLNSLAELLRDQGDYEAARPLYERALEIREQALGQEDVDTATSMTGLAHLLWSQGDADAAKPLYERALEVMEEVCGPEHPSTAIGLINLASVLCRRGEHDAAQPLLERSLKITRSALGPDHADVAAGLSHLARLRQDLGDHEGARPLFESALGIRERALGPEHPDTALALQGLAGSLRAVGELKEAKPLQQRALKILEKVQGRLHPRTVTARTNHALLLMDLGSYAQAFGLLDTRAGDPVESNYRLLASLSESERFAMASTLNWRLEAKLSVSEQLDSRKARIQAYDDVLTWKGQVARLTSASLSQTLARSNPAVRESVQQLRDLQRRLSALAFRTDVQDWREHEERLRALSEERNSLEVELVRSTAGEERLKSTSFHLIRDGLAENEALVDFLVHRRYEPARRNGKTLESGRWSEPRASAWITRADLEEPIRVDLGPADLLRDAATSHLRAIYFGVSALRGVGGRTTPHVAAEEQLRDHILSPLARHLGDADRVFVSPDDFFCALPLEVIPVSEERFAIESYGFVYLHDTSILIDESRDSNAQIDSLLVLGAVDYDERSALEGVQGPRKNESSLREGGVGPYDFLPATEIESLVVFDLHEGAFGSRKDRLLLMGEAATEESLKREMPAHALVHLATHGFFSPAGIPSLWDAVRAATDERRDAMPMEERHFAGELPGLLSGLVLAGANMPQDEREDGYLTAEEVSWLDLSGVELVVLSACDTGLGRVQSGEGLLGLRRAFQVAGAKTVVSSLWSVQDQSTADLMGEFYRNLWHRGMRRHEALRKAQLWMLDRNRRENGAPLPATWGAFVISGEWR